MDRQTNRSKTVFPPPPPGSGGIIIAISLDVENEIKISSAGKGKGLRTKNYGVISVQRSFHKLHIGMPYCGKHFWNPYMLIFLSKY
jgi:hypothetical protein